MKRIGVLLVLTLFALTTMQAQKHRERWVATDSRHTTPTWAA